MPKLVSVIDGIALICGEVEGMGQDYSCLKIGVGSLPAYSLLANLKVGAGPNGLGAGQATLET